MVVLYNEVVKVQVRLADENKRATIDHNIVRKVVLRD